jgi:hypothetical protein
MEQEFNIKKGWRIFGYIFCVVIILIALYFLTDAIVSNKNVLLWLGLNLVSILLFGYGIVAIYRGKIVLSSDGIIEYWAFGEKKLLFSEIKGFRIKAAKIILEPYNKSKSKMVIGDFSYTINGLELAEFLTNKFKDLDESDYNMEVSEAFNNPAISENVVDRERRIKAAKKVARFLNIGGVIIMIWLLFFRYLYYVPIILGLSYPLIVLIYFFAQQQIVTLVETGKPSVHPNLTLALLFPVGGLGMRVIIQFPLFNVADCIMPIALLFVVLSLLFVLLLRQSKARVSNLWMGLFFCLVYSASGIGMVNCAFDGSKPTEYKTRVLDHYITTGSSTTYYLKLDAWGPKRESEDKNVPKPVYDHVKNGDWATVYVKKGYLNIPWYFVGY